MECVIWAVTLLDRLFRDGVPIRRYQTWRKQVLGPFGYLGKQYRAGQNSWDGTLFKEQQGDRVVRAG